MEGPTMNAMLLAPIILLAAGTAHGQAAHASSGLPAGVQWVAAPPSLPPGAKMAVLDGDPGGSALFTIRLQFPDGYTVPPHFHPTDEHVTVISGTLGLGMGDVIDRSKMMTLRSGGYITAPAQGHHYAVARGSTVVQIHATGPFVITYVNPKDDPRRTATTP
jgi:quercetin dioxygenase-like cupin family protein